MDGCFMALSLSLAMKIPMTHAQGSLGLRATRVCPQGLVAGRVHVHSVHTVVARGHACCPVGSSHSASCYCRTSLLSPAALVHSKAGQERQRLFQSFPLVLEPSSSVGEEGLVHNTIPDVLLVVISRVQRALCAHLLTGLLFPPFREEN